MRWYFLIFCFAAGLELLTGAQNFSLVLHGGLIDPDSYMRLLRIEQGLRHGGLTNIVQRDDSGVPLIVEWSRLFDAGLVAMAAPFAPFIGWHRAVLSAGIMSGPVSAGLLGIALAFAAAPFSEHRFVWTAPVSGMLLPGIHGYALFGIVHYHVVMLAAAVFTAGLAIRAGDGSRRMALTAGVCGGIAIWIMPETMPFVLLAFAGLGWRWLFHPFGDGMAWLGTGFASMLLLGTCIDPPQGGVFIPEIDRISIVYGALGVMVLAVTLWLAALDRSKPTPCRRAAFGMMGALAAFIFWLMQYPLVALGPYGLMSTRQMHLFFGMMTETQPVQGVGEAFLLLAPAGFALIYGLHRMWRARCDKEAWGYWLIVSMATLLSLALTARFVIFQQFPAGCAAALLPVVLTDASRHFILRPIRAAGARIGLIVSFLIVPYAPAAAIAAVHTEKTLSNPFSCAMRHVAPLLAPAAGKIVLTRAGEVPELLYRTRIIAVGSLYQHGIPGYLRARAAWRAAVTAKPSAALLATGAKFVLFCPSPQRYALVRTAPRDTLWDALAAGHPPRWLRQTGMDQTAGFRLYRIIPPGNEIAIQNNP
jgi:hypothetical protein